MESLDYHASHFISIFQSEISDALA